jgi:O-antigen/teichoic acid export membrane protein
LKSRKNIFATLLSGSSISEIFKGSIFAFSIKILAALLAYIISYVIINKYSVEDFGVYSFLSNSLSLIVVFCGFGINITIIKFVGLFNLENNFFLLNEFYKKILVIVLPISIVSLIIVILCSEVISYKLIKTSEAVPLVMCFAAIIPLAMLVNINADIFRALRKIILSESIRLLIIPFITLLLILILGEGMLPSFYFVISVAIAFIISFFSFYILVNGHKNEERTLNPNLTVRSIIDVTWPVYVSTIFISLLDKVDFFMVSYFMTIKDVAYYDLALKLSGVIAYILYAVNSISVPKFSQLLHSDQKVELQRVVTASTKIMFFSSIPLFIFLFIFANNIALFFNPEFTDTALALRILLVGQLINVCSGSVGFLLNMSGHEKIFRNIVLVNTVLIIVLNLILVPFYGIIGGALSSAITIICWNLTSVYFVKKKLNIISYYFPFKKISS